jgi:geranyl-CoA carboxylase alpha subunit
VTEGERTCTVEVLQDDGVTAEIVVDGAGHRVAYKAAEGAVTWLALDDRSERYRDRLADRAAGGEEGGDRRVAAPMHGVLREVCVATGDRVARGQRLLVLEAMKMQHEVLAGIDGIVASVSRAAGEQVAAGEWLLEIDPADTAAAPGEAQ